MLEKLKQELEDGQVDLAIETISTPEFIKIIKEEREIDLYGLLKNEMTKKKQNFPRIMKALSDILSKNNEVVTLKMGGNNISSENELQIISNDLKLQNTGIVTLDFSNNLITSQDAISKLTIMLKETKIENISFKNNNIAKEDTLKALIGILRETRINHLDLSYNKINTLQLVKTLIEELSQGENNITSLDLGHNGIGANEKYSTALSGLSSAKIKNLYLADNSIKTTHLISALAEILENNNTLEHLDLGNNGLNEAGALTLLAKGIAKSGLKSLNLQSNNLNSKESISALISSLSGSKLTTLNLSNNGLNDIEAIKALSALKSTNITTLDLSFNGIDSKEKLHDLAKALKDTKVTKVILGTNVRTDISDRENGIFGLDKDFIEGNNLQDEVAAIDKQLQVNHQGPKNFVQKALDSTSRRINGSSSRIPRSPASHTLTIAQQEKAPLLTSFD